MLERVRTGSQRLSISIPGSGRTGSTREPMEMDDEMAANIASNRRRTSQTSLDAASSSRSISSSFQIKPAEDGGGGGVIMRQSFSTRLGSNDRESFSNRLVSSDRESFANRQRQMVNECSDLDEWHSNMRAKNTNPPLDYVSGVSYQAQTSSSVKPPVDFSFNSASLSSMQSSDARGTPPLKFSSGVTGITPLKLSSGVTDINPLNFSNATGITPVKLSSDLTGTAPLKFSVANLSEGQNLPSTDLEARRNSNFQDFLRKTSESGVQGSAHAGDRRTSSSRTSFTGFTRRGSDARFEAQQEPQSAKAMREKALGGNRNRQRRRSLESFELSKEHMKKLNLPDASSTPSLEEQIMELKGFQKRILKAGKAQTPNHQVRASAKHQTILDMEEDDAKTHLEQSQQRKRRGSITGSINTVRRNSLGNTNESSGDPSGKLDVQIPQQRKRRGSIGEAISAVVRRSSLADSESDERVAHLVELPSVERVRRGSMVSTTQAAEGERQQDKSGERRHSNSGKHQDEIIPIGKIEIKRDAHVILPNSKWLRQWDKMNSFVITWIALQVPFVLAFMKEEPHFIESTNYIIAIIFIMNMFLNCMTAVDVEGELVFTYVEITEVFTFFSFRMCS